MNNFTLSNAVDKDKVFMVNLSEIEGRIDPVMLRYQRKINKFKYNASKIKNLLVQNPQYGANEAGIERTSYKSPRYIRITDINEFGELNNSIGKTAEVIEHKYYLKNNDILIARSGNTVGKAYIHKTKNIDYDCFFAGYMIRFKFNEEKVLSEYIFVTTQLSFYKDWLNSIKRLAGQPNVNAEEYKNLKIPLPPLKIQNKIVNLYKTANQSKQQKEAEAEKLLNSIDDYLLNELGITLPEKDNSLQNRIFTTSLSKVCGGRFDCDYHSAYFEQVINIINNSNYPVSSIKKVADFQPGYAFSSNDYLDNSNCRLITIKNIRKNEIDIIDATFLPDNFYDKYAVFKININDLVFAMTGATIGKVGIFETNVKALLNQRNGIIRSTLLNTYYLMNLLNTEVYQEIILRNAVGGAQPNISETGIMNIKIPLPPIEKQNEIAEHISQIRNKAKQLQKEAVIELEKAKQEVEKMILGDGDENE